MVHINHVNLNPKSHLLMNITKKNQIITTGAIMSENECKRYFLGS